MSAISFILLFFTQAAFAGSISLPVTEVEKILIKGTEAQVFLNPSPANQVRIEGLEGSGSAGTYSVFRNGKVIEIRMNETNDKVSSNEEFRRALSAKAPKIEISGGVVPVEVQVRQGTVTGQRWSQDLKLSLVQGRVQLQQGVGMVNAHVLKGAVQISEHKGRVVVDSYEAQVQLRGIQGDGEVRLFSGALVGEKWKGFWTLQTQQSQVKLQDVQGTVQFENGKGSFQVLSLLGRLEGQNQEGVISAQLSLDSEVDVRTKSGRVQVQLAPGSGAALNLKTEEGEIQVPSELKVVRAGAEKIVRGKVRGDAQRGRVFVRAQDATISVK
jgi:hypothetical protein